MARGWTEWTQGFQFGAAVLQFDATGDAHFLELGRTRTLERMASHLTHVGVHDHGFNNVSTYGNLWRLAGEGRFEASDWERHFYELALKVSGAVQARRWTRPARWRVHPLVQRPALAVRGHDSLPAVAGPRSSAGPSPERGAGRADQPADPPGPARQGHGGFQCLLRAGTRFLRRARTHHARSDLQHRQRLVSRAQQPAGVLARSARGPAGWPGRCWALPSSSSSSQTVSDDDLSPPEYDAELRRVDEPGSGRAAIEWMMREAAWATCDFYLDHATASDGIPYWDTGAPGSRTCPAGRTALPIRSTTTSPSTAPPPALPRRACCGSAAI